MNRKTNRKKGGKGEGGRDENHEKRQKYVMK